VYANKDIKKEMERIFFAAHLKSTLESEAINYRNIQINKAIRFNLKWQFETFEQEQRISSFKRAFLK